MKVLCIDAEPSLGTSLKEGETYTVKSLFEGNQRDDEVAIPGMEHVVGYTLEEVGGHFRCDRFRIVEA